MWHPHPEVLMTDLGDELVLMHPQSNEMFGLNAAGRLLWLSLPATTERLSELLAQTYALTGEQAGRDTQVMLDELRGRALIEQS